MSVEPLGRDNPLLPRPKPLLDPTTSRRADIGPSDLPEIVCGYIRASLSKNTRRAYRSDLAHFAAWGGSIPSTPDAVAAYLATHARTLAVATLDRRLASISKAHEARGFSNPTRCELVRATRRGIKRTVGVAQRQAAPLLREDLCTVLATMGDTPKDIRDKALLLIGYAGGFRRSELVALDKEDIEITPRGIAICVRRSKTDQLGAGRRIGIPLGKAAHCPVAALERWLSIGAVETGPIFRRVNRHGNILHHRLSSEAVALIVKKRVEAAGFDAETYSGHSLRSGFATSAALIGVPSWKIRQQTGHASELMLSRYIRNVDMFREGAVTSVL